jgi:hypothetical protein
MKLGIFHRDPDLQELKNYIALQKKTLSADNLKGLKYEKDSFGVYQQSVTNRLLERPLINTLNKLVNKVAPKLALQKKDPLPKPDFKPVDVFELQKSYPNKMKMLRTLAPQVVGRLSLQYPGEEKKSKPSEPLIIYFDK